MSDLVKRLRIKAGMIEMGEIIAWGSDTALMREAADALEMAAPAVQGEPIPAGFALIKLDSRTGKPLVTSEMKAKHIGEYWWDEEAPYYDEHGDLHDYVARHAVPWSLCKEIYKNMASTAMLAAQPADQQPAPDVAALVETLEHISGGCQRRDMPSEADIAEWAERIDAALADYCKGGDT